ncbi:MAG: dienelactone hydrolase family protein [Sneathiellaceae bacterium]
MAGKDITITAKDGGSFAGYLASPPGGGPAPGIVVMQEIFGVNAVMREITDFYAAQGFLALCPDLFWRIEPGIQITDKSEEEWKQAFGYFQAFDIDKGMDDVAATITALRGMEGCTGKVGAVGYCLGGRLAYHAATRTDADAAVGYYGVGIQDHLDEASRITKPLMLHIASKDGFVPPEAQQAIKDGLTHHNTVVIYDYADQDHAFARMGGAHYDKVAADTANARTIEFFKASLA